MLKTFINKFLRVLPFVLLLAGVFAVWPALAAEPVSAVDEAVTKAAAQITAAEASFMGVVSPVINGMLSIAVGLFFLGLSISTMWELWKILLQNSGGGLEEVFAMLAKKVLIAGLALAFLAGTNPPAAQSLSWVLNAAEVTAEQAAQGASYGAGGAVQPVSGSEGVLTTWGVLVKSVYGAMFAVIGDPSQTPPPPTMEQIKQEAESRAHGTCSSTSGPPEISFTIPVAEYTITFANPKFEACKAIETASEVVAAYAEAQADEMARAFYIGAIYLIFIVFGTLIAIFAITIPLWKVLLDLIGTQLRLLLGGAVGVIMLSGLGTDFQITKEYSRKWFTFLVSSFFKLVLVYIVVGMMSVVLTSLAASMIGAHSGQTLHGAASTDEMLFVFSTAVIEFLFFGLVAYLLATVLGMVPGLVSSMLNGSIGGSSGFASAAADSLRGTADAARSATGHTAGGLKTAGLATAGLAAVGAAAASAKVASLGKGATAGFGPSAGLDAGGTGAYSEPLSPPSACDACGSRPCKCGGPRPSGTGAGEGQVASANGLATPTLTGADATLGSSISATSRSSEPAVASPSVPPVALSAPDKQDDPSSAGERPPLGQGELASAEPVSHEGSAGRQQQGAHPLRDTSNSTGAPNSPVSPLVQGVAQGLPTAAPSAEAASGGGGALGAGPAASSASANRYRQPAPVVPASTEKNEGGGGLTRRETETLRTAALVDGVSPSKPELQGGRLSRSGGTHLPTGPATAVGEATQGVRSKSEAAVHSANPVPNGSTGKQPDPFGTRLGG